MKPTPKVIPPLPVLSFLLPPPLVLSSSLVSPHPADPPALLSPPGPQAWPWSPGHPDPQWSLEWWPQSFNPSVEVFRAHDSASTLRSLGSTLVGHPSPCHSSSSLVFIPPSSATDFGCNPSAPPWISIPLPWSPPLPLLQWGSPLSLAPPSLPGLRKYPVPLKILLRSLSQLSSLTQRFDR